MNDIRKVVIPVAGYGTRFLPATKAMPKEMMPVLDKPTIQYVVEEAVASGITEVILVTGASKRAVEDHFDYNYELQNWLKKQGKHDLRARMKDIADMANFTYIRQKGAYGNGTPVLNAEHVVGNEPFAVVFGDEFFTGKTPRLKQLMDTYKEHPGIILAGRTVPKKESARWGMAELMVKIEKDVWQVKGIVEKPAPENAPSNVAIMSGYILPPEIFAALKSTKLGRGKELWLTDAITRLADRFPIYVKMIEGEYRDTGTKEAWMKTNIAMALQDPEIGRSIRTYIKTLL
ncbi:MAG: UTP--glucose-1-phosphate uridylyltransferase [Patescibacteria group bacterium]